MNNTSNREAEMLNTTKIVKDAEFHLKTVSGLSLHKGEYGISNSQILDVVKYAAKRGIIVRRGFLGYLEFEKKRQK